MVDRHFTLKISQLGYGQLCYRFLHNNNTKPHRKNRMILSAACFVTPDVIRNGITNTQAVDILDTGLLIYEIFALSPLRMLSKEGHFAGRLRRTNLSE